MRAGLCFLALAVVTLPSAAKPSLPGAQPPGERVLRDMELDAVLTAEARRIMRGVEPLPGQRRDGTVTATMDLASRSITVNFGRAFLPQDADAVFEDQLDPFRHGLMEASAPFLAASSVVYRFDGKELSFYFPELQQELEQARKARGAGRGAGGAMVSAGHGYYRRLVKDIWAYQRTEANDVLEDLITPLYAEELKTLIENRSRMPVYRPRTTWQAVHEASGKPWWHMAGRYHLEAQYPENPEIWNSLGEGSADNRHYSEDIRSRPLLANHQNVDVALHLHTNAAVASASGARVIYQTGNEQGRALGASVLCYMSEIINSAQGYENFVVSPEPHPDDKGENRLATMPSVIVEAAFHTNPDDARALQDPVFRTASMKGVEKGYRLWREGKGCTPLALQRATDVTLPPYSAGNVEVHFEGHPQFPVKMKIDPIGCPPGFTCTGGEAEVTEAQDSPLTFTMKCGRTTQTTVTQWQTVLRDDDGVASAPAMHRLTCTGPGSADKRTTTSQATGIGMF